MNFIKSLERKKVHLNMLYISNIPYLIQVESQILRFFYVFFLLQNGWNSTFPTSFLLQNGTTQAKKWWSMLFEQFCYQIIYI